MLKRLLLNAQCSESTWGKNYSFTLKLIQLISLCFERHFVWKQLIFPQLPVCPKMVKCYHYQNQQNQQISSVLSVQLFATFQTMCLISLLIWKSGQLFSWYYLELLGTFWSFQQMVQLSQLSRRLKVTRTISRCVVCLKHSLTQHSHPFFNLSPLIDGTYILQFKKS